MNATVEVQNQPESRELMRLVNQAAADLEACHDSMISAARQLGQTPADCRSQARQRRRHGLGIEQAGLACRQAAQSLLDALSVTQSTASRPLDMVVLLAAARAVKGLLLEIERNLAVCLSE